MAPAMSLLTRHSPGRPAEYQGVTSFSRGGRGGRFHAGTCMRIHANRGSRVHATQPVRPDSRTIDLAPRPGAAALRRGGSTKVVEFPDDLDMAFAAGLLSNGGLCREAPPPTSPGRNAPPPAPASGATFRWTGGISSGPVEASSCPTAPLTNIHVCAPTAAGPAGGVQAAATALHALATTGWVTPTALSVASPAAPADPKPQAAFPDRALAWAGPAVTPASALEAAALLFQDADDDDVAYLRDYDRRRQRMHPPPADPRDRA